MKYREMQRNSGDRMCENQKQVRCVHTLISPSFFSCIIHTQTIKVEHMYMMFMAAVNSAIVTGDDVSNGVCVRGRGSEP